MSPRKRGLQTFLLGLDPGIDLATKQAPRARLRFNETQILIAKSRLDLRAERRDTAAMRKLIALICALLVLPLLAAPHPALADPYIDNAAVDELFEELRLANNAVEADQISRQIWS